MEKKKFDYKENLFILINRVVFGVLFLVSLFLLIFSFYPFGNYKVVDDSGKIISNSTGEYSTAKITVTLNHKANDAYITIKFYGEDGKYVDDSFEHFFFNGKKTASVDVYGVSLKAVSYSIDPAIDADNTNYALLLVSVFVLLISLTFFLCSLMLNFKIYSVDGKEVVVYAGFYNHYIKVDGETVDEHKTLTSFVPIVLSTTLGESKISVSISTMNRITVKVNDKMIRPSPKMKENN